MNNNGGGEQVQTVARGTMSLRQAIAYFQVGEIVDRVGQWAVTDYGLECLVTDYAIEWQRLHDATWIDHMRVKKWVVIDEFAAALKLARDYHEVRL